jgi:arylsulfatase A-like enzyme
MKKILFFRGIISQSAFISVCLFPGQFIGANKSNTSPNIIYILADDLGYGDLGCYGQQLIHTPALDKMASEGIRFTNHYAGSTVSAPSRCSLITGLHQGQASVFGS